MNENNDILNWELGKIEDVGELVKGGRIDHYWNGEGINYEFKALFDEEPNHAWLFNAQKALEHFNLRSIEFGNWMSQNDRANFLYASMLSLHHLAKLFRVKDSAIGLNKKLSIALGARGKGKAAGHYERTPFSIINITKTQGIGVLAHEYAHAVDNIISFYTKSEQAFVSGGRSTRKGYEEDIAENGNFFEQKFEEFYNHLYFDNKGEPTDFLEKLYRLEDYWNRRNEVFARTMEVYVTEKLKDKKIKNDFLVGAIPTTHYPTPKAVKKVTQLINSIIKNAFTLFNKEGLGGFNLTEIDYKGFRKTLKENANLDDTLSNMQRIAYRDADQVTELAKELEKLTIEQTCENIWNYLRANTRYKLDTQGIEELRTPTRSLIDGNRGLTNSQYGIDCDDYTILISALLLSLGIRHEYRTVSYHKKGKFEHIYPVAFDIEGNSYVIDAVPEIPHFNYEAQPIIDLKTVSMELHELSGIIDTENKNELTEALQEPFTLNGITDESDDLLESHFLAGLTEVDNEQEAEIVLSGTEINELYERGLLAELNKAKTALIQEQNTPTVLSQTINVAEELERINALMLHWSDEVERMEIITHAIDHQSPYANFYKSLQLGLEQSENDLLEGIDEPIYLARADMEEYDLSELIEQEDEEIHGIGRRRRKKGRLKRFFKKVGNTAKKVAKAVVRYNPATIGVRGAVLAVLKTNFAKIASRLIYGYLTEQQAQAQNLNLTEWRKLKDATQKAEKFFVKIGGKQENFRKAIVKGRAAKVTGVSLNGLGVATATMGTLASGFIVFVKRLLSKVNPKNLFLKIKEKRAERRANNAGQNASNDLVDETDFETNDTPPPSKKTTQQPTNTNTKDMGDDDKKTDNQKPTFKERLQLFWTNHKKKIIGVSIGGVVVLIIVLVWQGKKKKDEEKEKRSLAGIKAAKTRARNRRKQIGTTAKRQPQLKGGTTILKIPTKSVAKARITKRSNGKRLQLMHKKAKELQKKHPKTKYSTLLKRASKMI